MILTFLPNCVRTTLSGRVSVEAMRAVDTALTYEEKGAWFSPAYKRGYWDGKRRLFRHKDMSFPAGLAHRVVAAIQSLGLDPKIQDDRPLPPWGEEMPEIPTELGGGVTLYADQVAALEAIVEARRGLIAMPTGSGKTTLMAALLKLVAPSRGLVIVDRKVLMQQTAQRLEKYLGEQVGQYGGGLRYTGRRVTVAMVQSLWHHKITATRELLSQMSTVIADEAHRISPKTWWHGLEATPATVRLGLSATIKEASRRLVVEAFLGPILFEEEIKDLVDLGRVARPRVAMVRCGGMIDEGEAPDAAYMLGVVRSRQRNALIVEAVQRCAERKLPALILVVRIEHGRGLEVEFEKAGLAVPFLHGGTPLPVIEEAKRDLEGGRLPAVVMSTIGDIGLDLPNVRALIIGSGQRSALLSIQRVGRGVRRKAEGENVVDVLDFLDMAHRNLRSQSEDRRRTYARKRMDLKIISSLEEWLC